MIMNLNGCDRGQSNLWYEKLDNALSFRPDSLEFAVIIEMPDGRYQIHVNELPMDKHRSVAVWNGVNWINLAKIEQVGFPLENLFITEWMTHLKEGSHNYMHYVYSAWKRQWKDFAQYSDEQMIDQLPHEHEMFKRYIEESAYCQWERTIQYLEDMDSEGSTY